MGLTKTQKQTASWSKYLSKHGFGDSRFKSKKAAANIVKYNKAHKGATITMATADKIGIDKFVDRKTQTIRPSAQAQVPSGFGGQVGKPDPRPVGPPKIEVPKIEKHPTVHVVGPKAKAEHSKTVKLEADDNMKFLMGAAIFGVVVLSLVGGRGSRGRGLTYSF